MQKAAVSMRKPKLGSPLSVQITDSNQQELRPRSLSFELFLAPLTRKDCWDHYTQGETVSGLYNISVTGITGSIQVYCDMDDIDGGWTVSLRTFGFAETSL